MKRFMLSPEPKEMFRADSPDSIWVCAGEHGSAEGMTADKAWFNYLALGEVTIWRGKQ